MGEGAKSMGMGVEALLQVPGEEGWEAAEVGGPGELWRGNPGTGEGVKVRVPRGHEEEGGEVGEERGEEGEKDERRREGEITECNNDARQRFSASQATKTLLAISRCKITLREIPIAFRHYVLYVCSFI